MKASYLVAILIAVALVIFLAHQARTALHASPPPDMPASSQFVQTGFDVANNEPLGQWVACRISTEQSADWCRVSDQSGSVVFEGQFLPVDSPTPVPAGQIHLARLDKDRMWTFGPSEQAPVPVIPLENGQTLVPASDRLALIARWASNPEERSKFLQKKAD